MQLHTAKKWNTVGSRSGSWDLVVLYLTHDPLLLPLHSLFSRRQDGHENSGDVRSSSPLLLLLLLFDLHEVLLNYFKPLFQRNMTTARCDAATTFNESAHLVYREKKRERENWGNNKTKTKKKKGKNKIKSSHRCRRLSKARPRYIFGWRVVLQRWIVLPGWNCSAFRGKLSEKRLPCSLESARQPRFLANIFSGRLSPSLCSVCQRLLFKMIGFFSFFFFTCHRCFSWNIRRERERKRGNIVV